MAFSDWSTTAGSNTSVGGVSIAENMNPSDVNNAMRAIMADARGGLATQSTLAAGTTTDLGSVVASTLTLTGGVATITGFGTISAGVRKRVISNAAHVLTHNATSLICPGGANITLASGDVFDVESLGSGNWRVCSVFRLSGVTPIGSSLELGTTQATTSGTSKDFTVPSGTKMFILSGVGVSTDGTEELIVQLGDAGGIETTGYTGTSITTTGATVVQWSSGVQLGIAGATTDTQTFQLHAVLVDEATFLWSFSFILAGTDGSGYTRIGGGSKALSAALTTVRLTTTNTPDTFDAGSVNIAYK